MSRDASPVQSAHLPQAFDNHHEADNFDIFADVSHHGSSLFELFAHPTFESLTPAGPRGAIPLLQQNPPESFRNHQSDMTMDLAVSRHQHQVDSYCTADPELSPVQNDVSQVPSPSASAPKLRPQTKSSPRKPARKPAKSKKTARLASKGASLSSPPEAPRVTAPKLPPTKMISKARSAPSTQNGTPSTPRRNRLTSQDDPDMDSESEASEAATGSSKHPSAVPPAGSQDTLSMGESLNKDTHNSHTRRCRAKVNSKFKELLSILPTPPPKTGIKHKAQILDYTIHVYRDIHARKTLLEAELALSSRQQLNSWVDSIISRSISLQDALGPYLSLICTKGGWKYSEAWVPTQDLVRNGNGAVQTGVLGGMQGMSGESQMVAPTALAVGPNARLRLGLAVIPSLGNTDDPDLQTKLERFRDRSRPYSFKPRVDLPGRIMCTMRPEWLPSLEDEEAFQRTKLARDASLVLCFGVPVFVRGHVAAVAVFFDTEQRAYDAKNVDLADSVASLLGNSFGANSAKRRHMR